MRYRRAISYDSKEYYMRLLSGNPGMYQHSIEQNTEGETTQQEPEHGEDTIARVKGHYYYTLLRYSETTTESKYQVLTLYIEFYSYCMYSKEVPFSIQ